MSINDILGADHAERTLAAQISIVGTILLDPEKFWEVELTQEHFPDPAPGCVWGKICDLVAAGQVPDGMLVADELQAAGVKSIDISTITRFMAIEHHFALEACVHILKRSKITRDTVLAASRTLELAREGTAGEELLGAALEQITGVDVDEKNTSVSMRSLTKTRVIEMQRRMEARAKGEEFREGVITGFDELDAAVGGLPLGVVTLVLARPGMGKSAFAMAIARNVSKRGEGVDVYSLEDTQGAYVDRAISAESGVALSKIKTCELTRGDLGDFALGADAIANRKHWLVDDRSGVTAEEIVRSVRKTLAKNNTRVVIIDYIQKVWGQRGQDAKAVLDRAMEMFSTAAKRDNISYLVLSQANREVESRDDKRPLEKDSKGSGALEEGSKMLIALYRPSEYDTRLDPGIIELIVRKNNHGPKCVAMAKWDGARTLIY